ncbi:ATP-binding cassette domain-containing protein [Ferruginibacter sp.]
MKQIFNNTLAVLDTKEKKHFGILILLDILTSIADILSLALLLWIVQFYIQPVNKNIPAFLPEWLLNRSSVAMIALFLLFFAVKNIAAYFISRAFNTFSSGVAVRMAHDNLAAYQQAPYGDFVHTDSSAWVRKICFQPLEYCQHLLAGIQQLITQYALILISIIAIVLFNAKIFLLLLLVLLPPVVAVFYFLKKKLATAKKHIKENNERSYQYLYEALKGYTESNIYQRNDFFLQRFTRYREKFSAYLFESFALQSLPGRIIEIFAVAGLFILIALASWTGNDDHATLITIGAFMAAAYKIIPGIVKIINTTGQMKAYQFATGEIENSNVVEKDKGSNPIVIESIELKQLYFKYNDKIVLKDVSAALNKGDIVGISGASGRGKTTLLNIVLGFLQPQKGAIYINGNVVDNEILQSCWPQVAYVRQQVFLIHDSLLKNITLEENGHDEKKLQQAIQLAGLDEFIDKSPGGINTIITENGKNISGGQQQRIAIARALYKDATVILLDEPFNELDMASTHKMLANFKAMAAAGKLVVMITHDAESLSYCNKIISLHDEA